MTVRVYVARHGETTWNVAGRYQGRRESTLTPLGEHQATALAEACAHIEPRIERIISSPLMRCTATAAFVAERIDVKVESDERLLEIAHGTWEGRLRDEIAADDPALFRRWKEQPAGVAFDGGETLADVQSRWRAFAQTFDAAQPTLVVTHDAVVRVAILDAQCRSLDDLWLMHVENAGFAEFAVANGRWTLVHESRNEHLRGLRAAIDTQAL